MSQQSRVIVTGASGFLAAWILPKLIARGHDVLASDITCDASRLKLVADQSVVKATRWQACDITDDDAFRAMVRAEQPATILHLAALQIPACRANPALGARVNVSGHIHALDAARESGARLIYTSSIAAKPRGPANAPANLYGVYKRTCEEISRLYAVDFSVASLGLRPHVVYGVGRDQGETSAITSAIQAAALGQSYSIPWTTSTCFQFAGDIAEMFARAVDAPWSGAIVTDMTDIVESTADAVAAIHACAPNARVTAEGPERLSPSGGFDVSVLESVIGARPITPLTDGVRITLEQFRSLSKAH